MNNILMQYLLSLHLKHLMHQSSNEHEKKKMREEAAGVATWAGSHLAHTIRTGPFCPIPDF